MTSYFRMNNGAETFYEYKSLLFSIAYNMLGLVDAAEDMVQETFLIWMEVTTDEIKHPKAYLVRIITNKCINYMNSARAKREKYIGLWLPEPLVNYAPDKAYTKVESYHALSFGILVLLERLTPQERAIFLLKEVFAYDYQELGELFDKTRDNCRQIFTRAKKHLGNDAKRFEVDYKVHEEILSKFLRAVSGEGLEDLIELLKDDVIFIADGGGRTINMGGKRYSATPRPVQGKKNVIRLLTAVFPKLIQYVPGFSQEITIVNNLPSILTYSENIPLSLLSIEHDGEQIQNIYIQNSPDKLRRFRK